jgi:hypothetical protein
MLTEGDIWINNLDPGAVTERRPGRTSFRELSETAVDAFEIGGIPICYDGPGTLPEVAQNVPDILLGERGDNNARH